MVNDNNLTSVDKKLGCRGITKLGESFARSFTMAGLRRKPRNDAQKRQIVTREHNINVGLKVRYIYTFYKMRVNFILICIIFLFLVLISMSRIT